MSEFDETGLELADGENGVRCSWLVCDLGRRVLLIVFEPGRFVNSSGRVSPWLLDLSLSRVMAVVGVGAVAGMGVVCVRAVGVRAVVSVVAVVRWLFRHDMNVGNNIIL